MNFIKRNRFLVGKVPLDRQHHSLLKFSTKHIFIITTRLSMVELVGIEFNIVEIDQLEFGNF